MLVELNVVEQRYRIVLEVLEDGLPVTEVAMRHGVSRQTVPPSACGQMRSPCRRVLLRRSPLRLDRYPARSAAHQRCENSTVASASVEAR